MPTVTTASTANQNLQRKQYSRFSFGKRNHSTPKDFENLEQISELLKGTSVNVYVHWMYTLILWNVKYPTVNNSF